MLRIMCMKVGGSIDVLDVLEEWIMINGKPKKIMHDNGKQFTSKIFKRFLEHNNIKDKPIPKGLPRCNASYNS